MRAPLRHLRLRLCVPAIPAAPRGPALLQPCHRSLWSQGPALGRARKQAAQAQGSARPAMAPRKAANGYAPVAAAPPAAAAVVDAEEENLLEAFALIANIDKAWCRTAPAGKVPLDITVQMSQRNLPGNAMRKFLSSAHIPEPTGDLSTFHWAPFPTEITGVAAVSPSPSGTRLLVVRNAGTDVEKAVRLEVWGAGRLLREVFVPPSVHRSVYADGTFESFAWNDEETAVAYVAEEPAPKLRVFGKSKEEEAEAVAPQPVPAARGRYAKATPAPVVEEKPPTEAEAGPGTWKGKGEWQSDWGEQYTGKGRPLPFVLNLESGKVEAVEGIPEELSVGQLVWAPTVFPPPVPGAPPGAPPAGPGDQSTLVFVGWSSSSANFPTARQLGFKYCSNRPSALYAVKAPGSAAAGSIVNLTPAISSAFSPQFSPDGTLLVFLSSQAAVDSGVHAATNSLLCITWPGDFPAPAPAAAAGKKGAAAAAADAVPAVDFGAQTVIDVVARPEDATGFPGLYSDIMVRQPWLADGRTLLLTTAWRSTQAIIAVHVETGRVSRLTPEGPISWKLLDVKGNAVIAGASTPACPTKLMLGRMNAGFFKQEGWLWSEISTPHVEYSEEVENSLKATEFEVLSIPPSPDSVKDAVTEGAKLPFEAIFVRKALDVPPPPVAPAKGTPPPPVPAPPPSPLVVVVHGGPHAVMTTSFYMPYAYLCALGYSVLHVNYRGSLGFGEEALQSLPGNIGRQDVGDVLEAIDRVVEMGYADPARIAIAGGSHGGFLAAHLIGQEPDRFAAAVLRNPVTNLAAMVSTSDIPDWCFVETFGPKGISTYTETPTVAELEAFLEASPITHAPKVKAPSLILLGGQDRRVPESQGLQLAQALKTQGTECKVIYFPEDVHSLEKPQTEFESWITIAGWLKAYL